MLRFSANPPELSNGKRLPAATLRFTLYHDTVTFDAHGLRLWLLATADQLDRIGEPDRADTLRAVEHTVRNCQNVQYAHEQREPRGFRLFGRRRSGLTQEPLTGGGGDGPREGR